MYSQVVISGKIIQCEFSFFTLALFNTTQSHCVLLSGCKQLSPANSGSSRVTVPVGSSGAAAPLQGPHRGTGEANSRLHKGRMVPRPLSCDTERVQTQAGPASAPQELSCPCSHSCPLLRQPRTESRAWPLGAKAGIEGAKELPVHRAKKQPLFPNGQHNTPGQVCRAAGHWVR